MARGKRQHTRFVTVLVCALAVCLVIMVACIFLSSQKMQRVLEDNLTSQVKKTREEQAAILRNIYYTSRNILGNVMYDTEIYKILKNITTTDAKAIRTMRNRLRLSQTVHLNDIAYRIVLLDMNGNMYSNWMRGAEFYDDIMNQSAVQKALTEGDSFFLLHHRFWYVDDENPTERVPALSFVNVVLDQYASKPIGILLFSVEERSLLSVLESGSTRVVISDALTGDMLCGSADTALYNYVQDDPVRFPPDEIVRMTWNNRQTLICRSHINQSNIELLQVMDYDEMYYEQIGLKRSSALLLLVSFGVMALVLIAAAFSISRPLRRLYQQICALNINPDGIIPILHADGYYECAEIAGAINDMSGRTMEMVRVIRQQQKNQAELKYQYLLSQLDPHFLLNTLNNVKWTAYMSDAPRVAEMITALGFLLETSLGKNQEEVTIEYEISHVHNYMLLQSMHFGNEITYSIEAEPEARALPFERFALQTLAGNAIKHGFVKGCPMRIDIRIAINGDDLVITVHDNGRGMTKEKLEQVRQELYTSEGSGHIGLRNLCQRLSYRYGAGARLTIDSEKGSMTCVALRVAIKALQNGRKNEDV